MLYKNSFSQIAKFTILLLVTLFLSSCVELKTLINVNKDGSGTIEESVTPKGMMAQLAALSSLSEAQQANQTAEEKEKKEKEKEETQQKKNAERAKQFGEDVQVVSYEEDKTSLKGKVLYSFTDINKIRVNPFSKAESERKEPISFSFKKGANAKLTITMPVKKAEEGKENKNTTEKTEAKPNIKPEQLQMVKGFFDGMKAYCAIKVNGQIKNTNATYLNKETSEIILLDFDFGKFMENPEFLSMLQNLNGSSGTNKDIFNFNPELAEKFKEIKVEQKEKVEVEF